MVDKKTVEKSCKICLALAIGIIAGVLLTKALDSKKDNEKEDCGCAA
jgi:hypothetical protein